MINATCSLCMIWVTQSQSKRHCIGDFAVFQTVQRHMVKVVKNWKYFPRKYVLLALTGKKCNSSCGQMDTTQCILSLFEVMTPLDEFTQSIRWLSPKRGKLTNFCFYFSYQKVLNTSKKDGLYQLRNSNLVKGYESRALRIIPTYRYLFTKRSFQFSSLPPTILPIFKRFNFSLQHQRHRITHPY